MIPDLERAIALIKAAGGQKVPVDIATLQKLIAIAKRQQA